MVSKSADQGSDYAQNKLGLMRENGLGTPQDYIQAYKWFNLAAAGASDIFRTRFIEDRDRLLQKMTPEQIAEGQKLSRQWRPTSN